MLTTPVEHGHVCVLDSPSTWSLETLNRIRSWVKTCTSSHGNCAKTRVASRLPRRLIDVGLTRSGHVLPTDNMGPEDFDSLCVQQLPNVRIVSSDSLPPDTPTSPSVTDGGVHQQSCSPRRRCFFSMMTYLPIF